MTSGGSNFPNFSESCMGLMGPRSPPPKAGTVQQQQNTLKMITICSNKNHNMFHFMIQRQVNWKNKIMLIQNFKIKIIKGNIWF